MRKILSFFLIFICLLPITGCWDNKDINKRVIVTTVIIDKKDSNMIVYYETVNLQGSSPGGSSGSGGSPGKYQIIKGTGKTLAQARASADMQVEQPLYFGSLNVIFLTERFSKNSIYESLARENYNSEYRKKVVTMMTNEEPDNIFKVNERGESVGSYITDQYKNIYELGETFYRPTARFIENSNSRYCSFLMPEIGLTDNNVPKLKGYCVFNTKFKNIGTIKSTESKGLIFLKADNAKLGYDLPYNNVSFETEVKLNNRKYKAYYKNGKISFDVNLNLSAKLNYTSTLCSISDDTLKKLQKELEMTIKKNVEDTIKLSQKKYKSDYLGFDDEFHIAYPQVYHKLNWLKEYPKIKVNVIVKAKLKIADGMNYETRTLE